MDVLKYINSKAMKEHLESIGYEFNSLEAAWLIYWCNSISIEEKHNAWNELIDTMTDCRIEERLNTDAHESLHAYLKEYMDLEDRLIKEFCEDHHGDTWSDNKPYVYRFTFRYDDGSKYKWPTVYSSFDAVKTLELEEDVEAIHIKRMKVDVPDEVSWAVLDTDLRFREFHPGDFKDKHEQHVYSGVFEGLWFDFPTPFKKGDILWNPRYPNAGFTSGPFVLTNIITDEGFLIKRQAEFVRNSGDWTDMTYYGYFADDETCGVYSECCCPYTELEYYTGDLKGVERVLIVFSEFIKGECSLDLCCQIFHKIMNEESTRISPLYLEDYVKNLL